MKEDPPSGRWCELEDREPDARVRALEARLAAALHELGEKERELGESEERFRVTFEKAPVGMAHVAPDGRWLRVNDKLCEIVGYGRDELLGLTFQDITHPRDLGKDLRNIDRVLKGEIGSYFLEKRCIRKDYRRIWISLGFSLVRTTAAPARTRSASTGTEPRPTP
ncbi:PAS domain S-box protein [Rubrobacter marinus]|uniref:PAS domain S-box protein n=1 Tax=Rubrobacter marinus TaxID=2653852 RepID=A0A6G8PUV3_9ACTN|nr:PAS domain S-box protein [Rubrobacter marinus]QIN77715.1 PAS domain S-box protein [Rubrobacter marinus]